MNLIGICGKAGSGKDTIADHLVRSRGFCKVALADPLKRFCAEVYGFTEEQLWGPSEQRNSIDPRWGIAPREALQRLGTEWGRSLHEDTWIRFGIRTAQDVLGGWRDYIQRDGVVLAAHKHQRDGVVIPDVRFANEVRAIEAAGGVVLHVTRPGRSLTGSLGAHQSETEQDALAFKHEVVNDGSIETMLARVDAILSRGETTRCCA